MNFYSTYYKNHATSEQTKVMKDRFDALDGNGDTAQADKALNANEFANIFVDQTYTDDQKNLLLSGFDMDDDGYLTYTEFSKAFLEFDVDDSTTISGAEGTLMRTKMNELSKEQEIMAQYGIINNLTSTTAAKNSARDGVERFNAERLVIHSDTEIQEKQILISSNATKAQEIQDYVDTTTLLEFERVQKLKEKDAFLAENEVLGYELSILTAEREVRNIDKEIIVLEQSKDTVTPPATMEGIEIDIIALENKKISAESLLRVAENNLKLYNNSLQITADQNLLTKFYVPEIYKENARKELEGLYDNGQLLAQQNLMNGKLSELCLKREQIAPLQYQLDNTPDTPENAAIRQALQAQINQEEGLLVLQATIETKKTDLLNKQIELKSVAAMVNHGESFADKKVTLETAIAELQVEIDTLTAQLP